MAESPHDPLESLAGLGDGSPRTPASDLVDSARAELANGIATLAQSIDEMKVRHAQTRNALAGLFGLLVLLEGRGEPVRPSDWKSNHRFVEARAVLARLGYSVDPVEVPRVVETLRARHWSLMNSFGLGEYRDGATRDAVLECERDLERLGYPIRPGDLYHGDSLGASTRPA